MSKNTSIALGEHYEKFVKTRVGSGRFNSASEVIRAGLRLLEKEEQKFENLKKALMDGENSGIIEDFNPNEIIENLHKKHGVNK